MSFRIRTSINQRCIIIFRIIAIDVEGKGNGWIGRFGQYIISGSNRLVQLIESLLIRGCGKGEGIISKRESILTPVIGPNQILMGSVRLDPKKTGISGKQNGKHIVTGMDAEEILIFNDIPFINGIHTGNKACFSGKGNIQAGVSKGTGHQPSDLGSIHIDIKGTEKTFCLPFFGGDENLSLQIKLQGTAFCQADGQQSRKEQNNKEQTENFLTRH